MSLTNLTLTSNPNQVGTFDCQVNTMKVFKEPTDDYDILRKVDMGGSLTPFMVNYNNVPVTPGASPPNTSVSVYYNVGLYYRSDKWLACATGFDNSGTPTSGYENSRNFIPRGSDDTTPTALGTYYVRSYGGYPIPIATDFHSGMFIKGTMIENFPPYQWYESNI